MGDEFFKAMAPYLAANLLTVLIVYAYASYARLEREGTEQGIEGSIRLGATIMVLCFAGFGLYQWIKA